MCVSHLLDFVNDTRLWPSQGSPVEAEFVLLHSSGSWCCLKPCHFNQGCSSAVVVFWGTWQRLLTRGHMWSATPVIGFDFAFCTFCLCLIKGLCHRAQKHSWMKDCHGAQSKVLWWLVVWGKWGKLISVCICHFTISVSPSLGIGSSCIQALTYCFHGVRYYPASNSMSKAGAEREWYTIHATLHRLWHHLPPSGATIELFVWQENCGGNLLAWRFSWTDDG